MGFFADNVIKAAQEVIDSDMGPITKFNKVVDMLLQENVAYVIDELNVAALMVHPENRSKLGVNPFNVHKVGSYIKKVGGRSIASDKAKRAAPSKTPPSSAARKHHE